MSENNNKKDLLKDLIDKRSKALKGGGEKRIESQKNKGKLTARERLSLFFDNGKYEGEYRFGKFDGHGTFIWSDELII